MSDNYIQAFMYIKQSIYTTIDFDYGIIMHSTTSKK